MKSTPCTVVILQIDLFKSPFEIFIHFPSGSTGSIVRLLDLRLPSNSGAVKLNDLAFNERSMKLSGFVLDDLSFNSRGGGILSLTSEVR